MTPHEIADATYDAVRAVHDATVAGPEVATDSTYDATIAIDGITTTAIITAVVDAIAVYDTMEDR